MKSFRDSHETATMKGMEKKTSLRIEAVGAVDELDAFAGAAHACCTDKSIKEELKDIQRDLRSILSELAGAPVEITAGNVKKLDAIIEKTEKSLPPLRNFILTWNSREATTLNVCRTVARRAERRLLAFAEAGMPKDLPINNESFRYLNRLSDVFFALARLAEKNAGFGEEKWSEKDEAKNHSNVKNATNEND